MQQAANTVFCIRHKFSQTFLRCGRRGSVWYLCVGNFHLEFFHFRVCFVVWLSKFSVEVFSWISIF